MRSCTLLLLAAGYIGLNADPECPGYYSYLDAGSRKDCIAVYTSNRTFATAEGVCAYEGGHLTSIHSAFENNLLVAYGKQRLDSGRMWLGLKLPDPTSSTWSCPANWRYFDYTNQCYYANEQGGSYQYARLYCQGTRGGDLVSIHSAVEAEFVARNIVWHQCGSNQNGKKYGEALLGGIFSNGKLASWSDGSRVDYVHYVWREKDGVLLVCGHDGGSGCGDCYNGDWYGPGFSPSSGEAYASFVCMARPWGH
ncbi:unnamed protein product, partial [Mesorhabditis spiculigera]